MGNQCLFATLQNFITPELEIETPYSGVVKEKINFAPEMGYCGHFLNFIKHLFTAWGFFGKQPKIRVIKNNSNEFRRNTSSQLSSKPDVVLANCQFNLK